MDELEEVTSHFGEAQAALQELTDETAKIQALRTKLQERQRSIDAVAAALEDLLSGITGPVQQVSGAITASAAAAQDAANRARTAADEARLAAESVAPTLASMVTEAKELLDRQSSELSSATSSLQALLDGATREAVDAHTRSQTALTELSETAATQLEARLAQEVALIVERTTGLDEAAKRLERADVGALFSELTGQLDQLRGQVAELNASLSPEGSFQTDLTARVGHLVALAQSQGQAAGHSQKQAIEDDATPSRMRRIWQWALYENSARPSTEGDVSRSTGWHRDPWGRHQLRWWDGVRWTDAVHDNGQTTSDPPPPPRP